MRYNGAIINSSEFSSWWTKLAGQFVSVKFMNLALRYIDDDALQKSNSRVIFDLQNEPNGIDATTVAAAVSYLAMFCLSISI